MTDFFEAAAAILPGLAWLVYFYRSDRFEPEPKVLVARTFGLGVLLFLMAFLVEELALTWMFPGSHGLGLEDLPKPQRLWFLLCFVGPLEEGLKFLAAWLSIGGHPEYDEPMDGVLYLTAAALGFATAENLYFLILGSSLRLLLFRGFFSCFFHAATSGLLGYWWSVHRFRGPARGKLTAAFLAASLLHVGFDALLYSDSRWVFWGAGGILFGLDLALFRRITQALEASPFRHNSPGED